MNKFLSLEWFKSKAESAVERVVSKKLESLMEQEEVETVIKPKEKLYKSLNFINDVLLVVLTDDTVLNKPSATENDFYEVSQATSLNEIYNVMGNPIAKEETRILEAEKKRIQALQAGIEILTESKDFTVEENTVYLTGTSRSLPQLLVEKFIEVVSLVKEDNNGKLPLQEALNQDEEYNSLKNFFMWCCLNPRAEVAHELYRFLTDNSFRLTKQGFFVALRNVVTVKNTDDSEIVKFISNAYNKVKAVWKKNPKNFYLTTDKAGNTLLTTIKPTEGDVRNLTELYLDLPNMAENRFTDDYTRTFDIRIGKVVNMPLEDCNWSTQDCAAAGLHFTSDHINYVGCGDTSALILINPMKVVGIGQFKGRCYEYLPIMTVPVEESTTILHDLNFDTLQLDEAYAERELESLAEKAKEGFSKEATKYQFNLPQISSVELNNIVLSLSEMKIQIDKRVNIIE